MNFDFQNPYPSTRIPVFARNVVSTSHPLAAQAGLRMLATGGNAVDAAVATAAAMTILEPVSNGLGSDAFCILWDGKQLHALNAAGRSPAGWHREYFVAKYGAGAKTPPKRGIDSVTVPGAVSAWAALSERFGKLPFADLMAPAIEIAERGYLVPPVVRQKWAAGAAELKSLPGFAETFMPFGRAPEIGELFQAKGIARALRAIAKTGGKAFYQGEIAEALVKFSTSLGGCLTREDLANHRAQWVDTISRDYRGYSLHELPPSGQGIAALLALGILEKFDVAANAVDTPATQHLLIEAMKLAFADTYRFVADPRSMDITAAQMLDDSYLAERAKLIDPDKAQDFGAGNPVRGGTIYLTAADERGMMVSFIQSNFQGFGSGCVEPTFGVSLQNRGFGFSMDPASPNVVAPDKQPFHTIIPAFLMRDGHPVMSFGVMGGNMQPQGHMQTIVRMIDYRQNPQAACDAPRWRYNAGVDINLEATVSQDVVAGLAARGHKPSVINDSYQDFGAGQFIWSMGDPSTQGYVAASDPRRDGAAVGF